MQPSIISSIFAVCVLFAGMTGFGGTLPEVRDFDRLQFDIQTFDLGMPIPEKFGHIQIRVRSKVPYFDRVVTWGMYDFRDPNFLKNFLKGHTNYRILSMPTSRSLQHYKQIDRTYWEQPLNLSTQQKKALYGAIQKQLTPPNDVYLYRFFADNCSTRIRDLLDLITDGEFKRLTSQRDLGITYRDTVRQHQATTWMTGLGLSVWANEAMDQELTPWSHMYLPAEVRVYASELIGADGRPLLGKGEVYGTSLTPVGLPWMDELGLVLLFMVPFAVFFLTRLRQRRRFSMLWNFAETSWVSIWWLCSGLFGSVMLAGWVFSDLYITHHSANLLLLWPLDLLVTPIYWLRHKIKKFQKVLVVYVCAHLIGWLIHALSQVLPLWEQVTRPEFFVFGTIQVLVCLLVYVRCMRESN